MSTKDFPDLKDYIGHDLITTDGTINFIGG